MPVYSMTGYASVQKTLQQADGEGSASPHLHTRLGLEIRSVNSRFLDLTFKMPEELRQHEAAMRELVTKHLKRGKVEVRAHLESTTDTTFGLRCRISPPSGSSTRRTSRSPVVAHPRTPSAATPSRCGCPRACRRVFAAVTASPITSKPAMVRSIATKPPRTTGWSSATRTRIGASAMRSSCP